VAQNRPEHRRDLSDLYLRSRPIAFDPLAISDKPAVRIITVVLTAPDKPAADAKLSYAVTTAAPFAWPFALGAAVTSAAGTACRRAAWSFVIITFRALCCIALPNVS
jgi:hypothetical protein